MWSARTDRVHPHSRKVPHMQVIAILDVDDVDHWFTSTDRPAFFESRGMRATPFRNPAGDGNSVALLVEAPDMETLQSELATPEAAETEVRDGVHVSTIRMFIDEPLS
jgi:hypothetical protein